MSSPKARVRFFALLTGALCIFFLGTPPAAHADGAPLKVVTTQQFLADIASDIGGKHVETRSLANPQQDPHYVQPRPTLMKACRDADVFVEVGMDLELWAEKVVSSSGNVKIQSGQPARVIASFGVPPLELPKEISREWGDLHPYGNPHVWIDPLNGKIIAGNIASALENVDPANADDYKKGLKAFDRKIDVALFGEKLVDRVGGRKLSREARHGRLIRYLERKHLDSMLGGWMKEAAPLRGKSIVTYHKAWAYLSDRFGVKIPMEIEEKPGITPSAKHRDAVVDIVHRLGIKSILIAVFYDRTAADYISEETGAKVVQVPMDCGSTPETKTYVQLIGNIIHKLVAAEGA